MLGLAVRHHVAFTVLISVAVQVLGTALSVIISPRCIDSVGVLGAAAAVAASVAAEGGVPPAGRRAAAAALVCAWALRLSAYLYWRNRPSGVGAAALSLSRTLWSVCAALPAVLLVASDANDVVGVVEAVATLLAVVALVVEALADAQKARWWRRRSGAVDPPVLTAGLWALSRHPNLFGEALFHAAVWALAARGAPCAWATLTVVWGMGWHVALSDDGPVVTAERMRAVVHASSASYRDYVARTSVFVPMPPGAWAAIGPRARSALFESSDWRRGAAQTALVLAAPV